MIPKRYTKTACLRTSDRNGERSQLWQERLYDVSVDNLIHYNQKTEKFPIPPSGKHIFGTVKVGERGQIVLPKKARDIFQISPGDLLVVLGDETPGQAGIALTPADAFLHAIESLQSALFPAGDDRQKEDSNP
ncbi:MAG: AbrB/MazE/SpoVT family DNA-binding domain-containing protein [Lachnospiraceae bacterium]|jgi:AbrB family looped-hinge helix DNA binding protein|nr:AbrB/MazE/SpoVT family DNA-binding domain-containing protein [Lachnospiraceae bacterium]